MDSSEDDDKPEELKPVVASEQSAALVHYDLATVFLGGLFCLAAIAALQASSAIVVPVVFAFIFNLLLQAPMRILGRLYVPRIIGAVLAIGLIVGSLVGVGAALSGPAASWAPFEPA
jgi:predicted PurR-regulated permease PerM